MTKEQKKHAEAIRYDWEQRIAGVERGEGVQQIPRPEVDHNNAAYIARDVLDGNVFGPPAYDKLAVAYLALLDLLAERKRIEDELDRASRGGRPW